MLEEFLKATLEIASSFAKLVVSEHDPEVGYLYWIKFFALTVSLCGALFYAYYWGKRAFREKIHQILVDPDTFWSKRSSQKCVLDYREKIAKTIPVIAMANYKGGVGKSMISANLAGYFDKIGLRVLLIDYDYQGSLTDIVPYKDRESLTFSAQFILRGERKGDQITRPEKLGQSFERSFIHPAESQLSRIDSSLIYQWLTGGRKDDIRYNTHNYLSSPYIQNNFNLVIIDTPPRICAATANALCAATHVLMPTILDTVSSRAVFRSVQMFLDFRDKLRLEFQIIGVVPSKVQKSTGYDDRESKALSYLKDELHWKTKDSINHATSRIETVEVLEEFPIMHKVGLLHIEGDDLKIFDENPSPHEAIIQAMFADLGNHILQEIGPADKARIDGDANEDRRATKDVIEFREHARAAARK